MAGHGLSAEQLDELVALAEGWGGIVADRSCGEDGPGFDVDLAGIEDLAFAVVRGLNKGVCEALVDRQAERLPEVRPRPTCGAECPVQRPIADRRTTPRPGRPGIRPATACRQERGMKRVTRPDPRASRANCS